MNNKLKYASYVMAAIVVTALLLGKCNCNCRKPVAPPVPAIVDINTPALDHLRNQRSKDSVHILVLTKQVDSLRQAKQKPKAKAQAAIARGQQTNNCDSLRSAFNDLQEAHDSYVSMSEDMRQAQGDIIVSQERIITGQHAEIETLKVKISNLTANYEGMQVLYEKQSKQLAKAERKAERRGRWNRILGAAAVGATTLFLITK